LCVGYEYTTRVRSERVTGLGQGASPRATAELGVLTRGAGLREVGCANRVQDLIVAVDVDQTLLADIAQPVGHESRRVDVAIARDEDDALAVSGRRARCANRCRSFSETLDETFVQLTVERTGYVRGEVIGIVLTLRGDSSKERCLHRSNGEAVPGCVDEEVADVFVLLG
jgi:hypothetical protein